MTTLETYRYAQEHPEEVQQAQDMLQAMLARSATDADLRQKLLEDPRGAISDYTGQSVPETVNIVFVENKADATFVLPDPVDADAELTDEELEAVAGGEFAVLGFTCAIIAAAGGIIAAGIIIAK